MPDALQRCYRPKPGFVLEMVDNELLIYHPTDATILYCNTTAGLVWQLCDGQRDVAGIVDLLGDSFAADRQEVCRDVQQALHTLWQRGALECVDATPASAE